MDISNTSATTAAPSCAAIPAAVTLYEQGGKRWAAPGYWDRRHAAKIAEIAVGPKEYDCVFVGDSITHNWEGWGDPADEAAHASAYAQGLVKFPVAPGRAVWEAMKKSARILNLGVCGDRTQNVLWRIEHGELDGYRALYVFLMIGTNNGDDTSENRAEGIRAIIARIAKKQPSATILLSPILPCGPDSHDRGRLSLERTNAIIRGLADGKRVVWVDFNAKLVNPDGTISPELMPDYLHPLEPAYRIWRDELAKFIPSVHDTFNP